MYAEYKAANREKKVRMRNAKLTETNVQQVRAMASFNFTTRSIAESFNVSEREICNIVQGKTWWVLPVVAVPLPIFPPAYAINLKLRKAERLTDTEQQRLEEYRRQLATQISDVAEREAFALRLACDWRVKRPRTKRVIRPLAAA
jgi:hypothetical protein